METPEPAAALADPPPPPIEPPPYSSPPARASDRPAISRRRLRLLRWLTYGSLAAFVVYSVISGQVGLRRQADFQLVANTTRQIGNNELQATVNDLSSRWFGHPSMWQPSGLPANTAVHYFAVQGATQVQLIDALDNSDICSHYHCLPDPAVPNAVARALEGQDEVVPSAAYCYSPSTFSFHFHHFIVLPQWSPTIGSVRKTLVQEWNALEGVLLTHEVGHIQIANQYLATLNQQSQRLATCQAMDAFWQNPHLWDGLDAAQNAYHARLRADCRPEIGCIPFGWMGW